MEKYQHGIKSQAKNLYGFLDSDDKKTIIALLMIEFALLLFVAYKGLGINYLPITGLLMIFTVAGCSVAFHLQADRYLLIIVMMLLNLGFVVQEVQSKSGIGFLSFGLKFVVAIVGAFSIAFLYQYLAWFLRNDKVVMGIMGLQLMICMVMVIFGTKVGAQGTQGATLTINLGAITITPFEIVKILYLFVASALLCEEENEKIGFGRLKISGEILFVIHTALLSLFFVLCKELGTLMVVYFTGLVMLLIFGKNRKLILSLLICTLIGFAGIWVVCDQVLYPRIASNQMNLPDFMEKIINRFGTALHPEKDMSNAGYQGTLALEALAVGELLGIGTERYRLLLPEAASDMVFANLVQTCGFLMGVILILFFFALLKRGMDIANQCQDTYFQGLAMAITWVIIIQTIIHIGYNIAILPITGIPLYFVSQGFTAIVTAMGLIAVLLVISTGALEEEHLYGGY